jgi:hypothetical protein
MKGLYRGWAITATRAAPAHALIFAGYEQTLQWLKPIMMVPGKTAEGGHFYD